MSTIRCVYSEEPNFPATDQHPDAVRYTVGEHIVDAIGGEPTPQEIDTVLNPPVAQEPTLADILDVLPQESKDALATKLAARAAQATLDAAQAIKVP